MDASIGRYGLIGRRVNRLTQWLLDAVMVDGLVGRLYFVCSVDRLIGPRVDGFGL